MIALETFVEGILDGHNLWTGIPILTIFFTSFYFIPILIGDNIGKSFNNFLIMVRMLIIWINVMYLLILYYNSTIPLECRSQPRIRHHTQTIDPNNLARILRAFTIDIRIPRPGQVNNIVIDDVDAENVHDSGVQNGVAESVRILKEKVQLNISEEDCIKEVKSYIFGQHPGTLETKEMAYCALNKINKENILITRLGLREREVLRLVWNRIQDPVNLENKENLQENLILELAASMRDEDTVLCPTGRVNRMVQALELADAEPELVNLRTDRIMKEEMELLFGKLRETFLDTVTEKERDTYSKGEDCPELVERMKQAIDSELRHKYLDTSLLNETKYTQITAPLFEELN